MWDGYRRWRRAFVPVVITASLALMKLNAEDSALWRAGVVLAAAMGLAYVIEEIAWNLKSEGRPCSNCGEKAQLKSFSIRNICPHCGGKM